MNEPIRSSTTTLIEAMQILSREIQSGDGVANAAIAEAAERLEELQAWKQSAMSVMNNLDMQAIAKEITVPLGGDISTAILPAIRELKGKLAKCKLWMDSDCRCSYSDDLFCDCCQKKYDEAKEACE